jgi:hypothetical protein
MENVMVYALDGIKAILGNTFQTLTMWMFREEALN